MRSADSGCWRSGRNRNCCLVGGEPVRQDKALEIEDQQGYKLGRKQSKTQASGWSKSCCRAPS